LKTQAAHEGRRSGENGDGGRQGLSERERETSNFPLDLGYASGLRTDPLRKDWKGIEERTRRREG